MNKKRHKKTSMRSILDFLNDSSQITPDSSQTQKETNLVNINGELWEIVAQGTWTVPDLK